MNILTPLNNTYEALNVKFQNNYHKKIIFFEIILLFKRKLFTFALKTILYNIET